MANPRPRLKSRIERANRQQKAAKPTLSRQLAFRLSMADYAAFLQKVEGSGLTASAFFREAVLANRTQIVARPVLTPDAKKMLFLANKIGNNINQLAHGAHTDRLAWRVSETTYGPSLPNYRPSIDL